MFCSLIISRHAKAIRINAIQDSWLDRPILESLGIGNVNIAQDGIGFVDGRRTCSRICSGISIQVRGSFHEMTQVNDAAGYENTKARKAESHAPLFYVHDTATLLQRQKTSCIRIMQ